MKALSILSLVLVIIFTTACSMSINGKSLAVVNGSGKVVTETREVSNFNKLVFSGLGDITITQGSTESLTIEAEDNILPHITTAVSGGTLKIGFDTESASNLYIPTKGIKFNLGVKSLNGIDVTGAGNLQCAGLTTDNLALTLSGAGNVNIKNLQASSATTTISGAGNIDLAGKSAQQSLKSSGIGNYRTGDLNSQKATVNISGAGGATVWATDSLDVTISGAGSVSYYGNPSVTKNVTGIGSVKSLGNK